MVKPYRNSQKRDGKHSVCLDGERPLERLFIPPFRSAKPLRRKGAGHGRSHVPSCTLTCIRTYTKRPLKSFPGSSPFCHESLENCSRFHLCTSTYGLWTRMCSAHWCMSGNVRFSSLPVCMKCLAEMLSGSRVTSAVATAFRSSNSVLEIVELNDCISEEDTCTCKMLVRGFLRCSSRSGAFLMMRPSWRLLLRVSYLYARSMYGVILFVLVSTPCMRRIGTVALQWSNQRHPKSSVCMQLSMHHRWCQIGPTFSMYRFTIRPVFRTTVGTDEVDLGNVGI